MSSPFDPGLADNVARIRLGLGDTKTPHLLADETIRALLDLSSESARPAVAAAVAGARALAAHFLKLADSTRDGDVSRSYGDRAQGYRDLAATIAAEGLPGDPAPPPSGLVGSACPVVALPGSNLDLNAYPFPAYPFGP